MTRFYNRRFLLLRLDEEVSRWRRFRLPVSVVLLEVEELRAHVSVQAEVLNLLRLSVGADVQLGGVHLEIKGVEAQALLKVRLDKIAEIINRVLSTIDRNPQIFDQIVAPLGAAARELEGTVGRSVDEVAGAVGSATPDLDRTRRSTGRVAGRCAAQTEAAAHDRGGAPLRAGVGCRLPIQPRYRVHGHG